MKQPTDREREATGKEIITAIVNSLVEGLEPMYSKTLTPGLFQVYLREADYDRLRGVFNELQWEAARALDEKVAALNRAARRGLAPLLHKLAGKLKPALEKVPEEMRPSLTGKLRVEGECVRPAGGWQISFYKNEDENSEPGDVVVIAMLTLPERPELGGGLQTIGIKTLARAGSFQLTERITPADPSAETLISGRRDPLATAKAAPLAVLRYRDHDGDHTFEMTGASVVIGRGGSGVWVDLKLNTQPEVSREHLRIKRGADGRFYLKDLSRLGTTIDGQVVPPSLEERDGQRVDKDLWVPLPNRARIELAEALALEFEAR
jgi:hypothetical protein